MTTCSELTNAIRLRNKRLVKSLLNNPDKDFEICEGNFVCQAAETGDAEIMLTLLERGADPKEPDIHKEKYPVHICAAKGHKESLQVLIQHGADINQLDSQDRTPLHWVALHGTAHLVKCMLENDAQPDVCQKDGFTPLQTAACMGYENVCHQLVTLGDVSLDRPDFAGWSALMMAVCEGHQDTVKMLTRLGANVMVRTIEGETTLHIACIRGHNNLVHLLLDLGVPINATSKDGATPLYQAVYFGHLDVAFTLIKAGADVHFRTTSTTASFINAVIEGGEDMLELLLSADCIVSPMAARLLCQHNWITERVMFKLSCFPSLKQLSQLKIRGLLAPYLQEKAPCLPLPLVLKGHIALKNLNFPQYTS